MPQIPLTVRGAAPPIILAVVVAVSTYWIFYGSSRGLNIAGAIILALSLFSVRKRYRVLYGVIEIGFAVFILAYNWRQGRGAFSAEFSGGFDIWVWQLIFIQTFAAIYIFVRGLDNIDQGSKEGKASHPASSRVHAVCRWLIARL
jgi:hypothetical protein